MNKTAIKNFAVWARNKLISEIVYKAGLIGITDKGIAPELPASTANLKFYDIGTKEPAKVEGSAIAQRASLVSVINRKAKDINFKDAFEYVVEEVAYTWFNRLIAIRFMEVNGYLPSGVRVLSSEMAGKNEPDMVTNPFDTDIDFTEADKALIPALKDNELFRFLFIKQCNKLGEILPELFEKTENYTELLLTLSFTDTDSVVYHLVHDIPEDDFNIEKEGQVQIIGWLYQYYIAEPKDALINAHKKYKSEDIKFVTQLFTSDWIVHYMVENSLGRLWVDSHSDFDKSEWKYYLEEAEQEESVKAQLNELCAESKNLNPEDIRFIDPCMGSGHILVYAFDVLMQIYLSQGYTERDAASLIIEKNLYGADIDKRAYQLSYFALMMKARQYDRRFLTREDKIKPNLCNFQELTEIDPANLTDELGLFAKQFANCDTYGSLIEVQPFDTEKLSALIEDYEENLETLGYRDILEKMLVAYRIFAQKYDVCCTNPPYMNASLMPDDLKTYIAEKYSDYKSDLFSAFMVWIQTICKKHGHIGLLTPYVWMFISSYEKLRLHIHQNCTVTSLVQLEYNAFESACVPVCSFTLRNDTIHSSGQYIKLSDFKGIENQAPKTLEAVTNPKCGYRYTALQENFSRIPGAPVAYWVSENFTNAFTFGKTIEEIAYVPKGLSTGCVDRFMRFWYEINITKVDFDSISCEDSKARGHKWFPYAKGGSYRRWNGNLEYVVNWENDGLEIKGFVDENGKQRSRPQNTPYYFKRCITYSAITSGLYSVRYLDKCIFGGGGDSIQSKDASQLYPIMGFLNSVVAQKYLNVISPTMNFEVGHIKSLPFIFKELTPIDRIVEENISLSKTDWDSFETSWDFKRHPLLNYVYFNPVVERSRSWVYDGSEASTFSLGNQKFAIRTESWKMGDLSVSHDTLITGESSVKSAYDLWEKECNERFYRLKANEEELNRIFIDIYGLQDELTPEVEERDVTVRKADLQREIKSLISYAVGCMFGRYSLNKDGLIYAGGEWDESKYRRFIPDADNIIPITDEEYFSDDIVGRFVEFIRFVYGEDSLEENLDFIAKALGNRGNTSRQIIRSYFLSDFIKDHIKTYQKRPIYWLFDSGKQNGFKALVYMHRWNADTIGNVRVDYLHKLQRVYESEIARMQETIDNSTDSREVANAEKRKDKLLKQLKETREYDEKLSHLALARIDIDLDDGVKVNYEKVQTAQDGKKLEVLVPIK